MRFVTSFYWPWCPLLAEPVVMLRNGRGAAELPQGTLPVTGLPGKTSKNAASVWVLPLPPFAALLLSSL